MSTTGSNAITIVTEVDLRPWKHQRTAAVLERLCELSGHLGACALLNGRWHLFYDRNDEPRLTIRIPSLWRWAQGPL